MASLITGATVFQRAIGKGGLGIYIPNAHVTDLSAGSVTSPIWLRNSNHSRNHYLRQESLIFMPMATSIDDYVRHAADLTPSTGKLNFDSDRADVTLGTEDFYLLDHGIQPMWIIDAMNRALEKDYFENVEPLSLAADASF